jgi:RNA polymerase sigma-70 factor (ECF subfamily)
MPEHRDTESLADVPPSDNVQEVLARNRDRFLTFLKGRINDPALAEELLQSAFLRSAEHSEEIRDEESAVAWFYRVLRNAVIDHHRHVDAERRALARFAEDLPEQVADAPADTINAVCQCVGALTETLRPEYRDVLEKVDLGGAPISSVAAAAGLTANNARVRLHRARRSLKRRVEETCGMCATHGCLDCTCKAATTGSGSTV